MIYKERMSYYDMDSNTAQMYKPIDEYLRQSKRFSSQAMKKKYTKVMLLYSAAMLVLLFLFVKAIIIGKVYLAVLYSPLLIVIGALMIHFIRYYGETPDMDYITCENIIDKDGIEHVYDEYTHAKGFGNRGCIGREYLFVCGHTLVRLASISCCSINAVSGEDSTTYYFRIHVHDDLGMRYYDLDILDGNAKSRDEQFAKLKSTLEEAQKKLEQAEI